MINYMLNGKVMIVHLIAWLIKKTWLSRCDYIVEKMSENFPKLYELFGGDINVNVELQIMIQKLISKM